MKTLVTALVALAFIVGCPNIYAGKAITSTLRVITSDGILSTTDITIKKNESVVWNNKISGKPIQIIIDDYVYPVNTHPLTRGFVKNKDSLLTKNLVVPGVAVSYFFDHEGDFKYTVIGEKINFKGTITVKK